MCEADSVTPIRLSVPNRPRNRNSVNGLLAAVCASFDPADHLINTVKVASSSCFRFLGNAKLPESESHMEASNAVHSAIGLQAWSLKRPHITLEKAPTEDVEDGAMNVDHLGQSLR